MVVAVVAAAWVVVGMITAVMMRRRGHTLAGWLVLGVLFGPFTISLAIAARSREETAVPTTVFEGERVLGQIDVLVGFDGSPESEAALRHAVRMLGPGISRLAIATVVDFEAAQPDAVAASREVRDAAIAEAEGAAATVQWPRPEVVILGGRPADALGHFATTEGFDVVVVGAHGRSASKAILGSTSARLIRECPVPVLVSGAGAARGQHAGQAA